MEDTSDEKQRNEAEENMSELDLAAITRQLLLTLRSYQKELTETDT